MVKHKPALPGQQMLSSSAVIIVITAVLAVLIALLVVGACRAMPEFSSIFSSAELFQCRGEEASGEPGRRKKGIVGGLANTGNTCFMNSVLQALASTDTSFYSTASCKVTASFHDLIDQLNTCLPASHIHTPASLLRALDSARWTSDTEQQDAHEFLLALIDSMRTELTAETVKSHKLRVAIDAAVHGIAENTAPDAVPPVVALPFDGLLSTRVTCLVCNEMQSLRHQVFSSLELSLPTAAAPRFLSRPDSVTLAALLESAVAPETLENVHCQRCSLTAAQAHLERLIANATATVSQGKSSPEIIRILGARRDAIEQAISHPTIIDADFEKLKPPRLVSTRKERRVRVAKAPECLVLHINRSEYDARFGIAKKKNTKVEFGEYLKLGESVADDEDARYRLVSTVHHFGSHSFGHYICHRRTGASWVRISDRDVRDATVEDVVAQGNVVLLFYQRDRRARDDALVRLETDIPIFDAHENDLSDGVYSSSSSSVSSPVRDEDGSVDDDRSTVTV